jgi:hypothetical protein
MDHLFEIHSLLQRIGFDERQQRALRRRLGLDGRGPTTLAGAAAECGYTRERVRQLEQRLREHVRAAQPPLPATTAALARLDATAPLRTDIATSLLRIADVAGLDCRLVEHHGAVLHRHDVARFDRAYIAARKLVERHGATTAADVSARIGARADALLAADARIVRLDAAWLTTPVSRCPIERALRKLLPVTDALGLDDLADALATPLPLHVLSAVCARIDGVTLVGARVFATHRSPRRLSGSEDVLVRIFNDFGPVVTTRVLLHEAEERGLRPQTAAVSLSRSPLFQRVGRARHALVGFRGEVVELRGRQRAADAANSLRDALLVLDEREANPAFAVDAEAAAGADGDMRLAKEA